MGGSDWLHHMSIMRGGICTFYRRLEILLPLDVEDNPNYNTGKGYDPLRGGAHGRLPTADGTHPKLLTGAFKALHGLDLNYQSSFHLI